MNDDEKRRREQYAQQVRTDLKAVIDHFAYTTKCKGNYDILLREMLDALALWIAAFVQTHQDSPDFQDPDEVLDELVAILRGDFTAYLAEFRSETSN